jgi:7-keto-8-aminopelargonate synthetase-like enzyme
MATIFTRSAQVPAFATNKLRTSGVGITSMFISDVLTHLCRRLPATRRCLNLGSYNYLGFAASDEYCTDRVVKSLHKYSASTCSSRMEVGTTDLHVELEELVARFVGKPAAVVYGMGFATNSTTLPALAGKVRTFRAWKLVALKMENFVLLVVEEIASTSRSVSNHLDT